MKILDCTLRDGGYYTNWDFSNDLVTDYLECVSKSKVDYVELGMRQFPKSKYLGPFAYTPESLLNNMNLPSGPEYGVMIDASAILKNEGVNIEESINALFVKKKQSKISLVRIAAHPEEVSRTEDILKCLNKLGYLVALNIMQVSMIESGKLSEICNSIRDWETKPTVLYFADSLGNMTIKDINNVYTNIQKNWCGPIGFHAHNNMGLALENAIECINLDLDWLDATVTGMGRGAGNLSLEDVLLSIKDSSLNELEGIFNLVQTHFQDLKNKYKYGPSLLYRIAARYSIHPTYIQTLAADNGVEPSTHISVVSRLKELKEPNKFSEENYNNCLSIDFNDGNQSSAHFKTGNIYQMHPNRDFLIIGGSQFLNGAEKILKVLETEKNLVSISSSIKADEYFSAQYLCATSNNTLTSKLEQYDGYEGKLILPKNIFMSNKKTFSKSEEIFFYGHTSSDKHEVKKNYFSSQYFFPEDMRLPRLFQWEQILFIFWAMMGSKHLTLEIIK